MSHLKAAPWPKDSRRLRNDELRSRGVPYWRRQAQRFSSSGGDEAANPPPTQRAAVYLAWLLVALLFAASFVVSLR